MRRQLGGDVLLLPAESLKNEGTLMIGLEKILLVEDNPKDLELALTALEDCHLANELAVTRDGAEALDYLRRQGAFTTRPDRLPVVVLLDLKLPKLNGLEVLARIRADSALKQL